MEATSITYQSRAGLPCTERLWLHLATDPDYRTVAEDLTTTDIEVSTWWTGWRDGEADRLYETVITHSEGALTLRWPSETEARSGHDWLVDELGGAQ